jgi:hypothetical protein
MSAHYLELVKQFPPSSTSGTTTTLDAAQEMIDRLLEEDRDEGGAGVL